MECVENTLVFNQNWKFHANTVYNEITITGTQVLTAADPFETGHLNSIKTDAEPEGKIVFQYTGLLKVNLKNLKIQV